MYFGEKLKRLRQERNWTQPDLADRLGIEQSWLSKIENDKCIPSSELMQRIAEVFSMTLTELLDGLDKDHVVGSLGSLPEVRGLLKEQKYQLVHRSRDWLLSAGLLLALGATFFIAGAGELFFSNTVYVYESEGLVFASEPEDLFADRDNLIQSLLSLNEPNASGSSDGRMAALEQMRKNKTLEIARREQHKQILSPVFQGLYLRMEEPVPEQAVDIFGNQLPAGSTGSRLYYQSSTRNVGNLWNNILLALGIFMVVFGVGLFVGEWRMARLSGLTGNMPNAQKGLV